MISAILSRFGSNPFSRDIVTSYVITGAITDRVDLITEMCIP